MTSVEMGSSAALPRVLVIEHRMDGRALVQDLESAGVPAVLAWTAAQGRVLARENAPHVALLGLDLPEAPDLLRWLVERAGWGVIGLSSSADGFAALELGADDVVSRPPRMRELAARIRAVHRRLAGRAPARAPSDVRVGPIRIHPARRAVTDQGGKRIPLTAAEFALLEELVQAQGRTVSRDALSEAALRRPWRPDDRSVDQLVFSLRQKLPPDDMGDTLIHSIRGAGYVMRAPDPA